MLILYCKLRDASSLDQSGTKASSIWLLLHPLSKKNWELGKILLLNWSPSKLLDEIFSPVCCPNETQGHSTLFIPTPMNHHWPWYRVILYEKPWCHFFFVLQSILGPIPIKIGPGIKHKTSCLKDHYRFLIYQQHTCHSLTNLPSCAIYHSYPWPLEHNIQSQEVIFTYNHSKSQNNLHC